MDVGVVQKSHSQEKHGRVQSAIILLVLVVFLGWIFIWIMAPTNTYKQKLMPWFQAKTSSIFDKQGLFFIHLHVYPCSFSLLYLISKLNLMIFFLQVQHFCFSLFQYCSQLFWDLSTSIQPKNQRVSAWKGAKFSYS